MTVQEFRLPDVGEGLTEADILAWHVAPGDYVELNAVVVEVETAKAAVELPSPFAGKVVAVKIGVGETVAVGTVLFTVATGASPGDSLLADTPAEAAVDDPDTEDGSRSVLVGYGPTRTSGRRRARREQVVPLEPAAPIAQATNGHAQTPPHARATPPVRKLARSLGVDLGAVVATGPHGTVTRDDVHAHAASGSVTPQSSEHVSASPVDASSARVDGAGDGDLRTPIKGVRKATAQAMVASAFTAPHVTEFLTVDVTATMELVARLRTDAEFADVKVTPLSVVAAAVLSATRRHPDINARWDEANHEILRKADVNLGIAAATPRGLIVPNIKRANTLSLHDLAAALADLTATAREGRTPPDAMAGGTITITNIGVFGIDAATPILNPGEAAILCFGAIREMPWVHEGQVVPRHATQLSLSFDHRLVDGELGSRVLAHIGAVLTDPVWRLATA